MDVCLLVMPEVYTPVADLLCKKTFVSENFD